MHHLLSLGFSFRVLATTQIGCHCWRYTEVVTCNAFARISAIYLTERIRDSWKFFREILNPSAADSSAPMGHLRTLWSDFLVYCSGGLTVGNLKREIAGGRRPPPGVWIFFSNSSSIAIASMSSTSRVFRKYVENRKGSPHSAPMLGGVAAQPRKWSRSFIGADW